MNGRFWRGTLLGGVLLLVATVVVAQQTGPIGTLRGTTDAAQRLLVSMQDAASSVAATVFDYTSSNPLAVRQVDSNGDPISDVAHAATSAGNPVPIGFKAESSLSTATLVSDGQRAYSYSDLDSALYVRTFGAYADVVSGVNSNTDGASTSLIATAGSGVKQYLSSVTCANTSTTGIYVELKSGTTVKWRIPVPAAAASDVNGYTFRFDPPLPPNAADEAWNTDGSAAVTTLYCSGIAIKSKI